MKNNPYGVQALICALALVLFAGCGVKQPRALYEKEGAFSYNPPPGWKIVAYPGLKYRISHGSAENDFTPNINVVEESFKGTLTDYAEAGLSGLRKLFSDLVVVTNGTFTTQQGKPASYYIVVDNQYGRKLRQSFYCFANSERKYTVTCTTLAEGGELLDDLFYNSMISFTTH